MYEYDTFDPVIIFFVAVVVMVWVIFFRKVSTGPPTVEELGRASWTLLHTTASKYPLSPDTNLQRDAWTYLSLFAKFYPCSQCSEHMMGYLRYRPPQLSNRDSFQKWLCAFHNNVNTKLGKPSFDCGNISAIHKRWGGNVSTCPVKGKGTTSC